MNLKENAFQLMLVAMCFGVGTAAEKQPVSSPLSSEWHFDFGNGPVQQGYTRVISDTLYTEALGYGFLADGKSLSRDRQEGNALRRDAVVSHQPLYFTANVPEGNYRVTVTLGDLNEPTNTTVKAELRRLMLLNIETKPGEYVTRTFMVNVRRPPFPGGEVRLKGRERTQEAWAWDGQLTLEFNGKRPCICGLDIVKVDGMPTVFILGDSTVCDQSRAPWNSWGQMLTLFFQPSVVIANHAESGESIRSSLGARRFDKVYSLMKPGDYLLIQYGHNDMKDRTPNSSDIYKQNLKTIVAKVRELGGTPVLITSMERKAGIEHDTLQDYPDKVRQVAAENNVALIDLHAMSKVMYKALGDHLDAIFQDGTHHNNFGSYLFAKCVMQGIKDNHLDLARHITDDFTGFDPAHPDAVDAIDIPVSSLITTIQPLGD